MLQAFFIKLQTDTFSLHQHHTGPLLNKADETDSWDVSKTGHDLRIYHLLWKKDSTLAQVIIVSQHVYAEFVFLAGWSILLVRFCLKGPDLACPLLIE